MLGKRQIHILVDQYLYQQWIESRRINNISERLTDLIKADCDLSDDDKERLQLERELGDQNKLLIDQQNKITAIKIRLADLTKKDDIKKEEERQMKLWEQRQKADLAHEMVVAHAMGQDIFPREN